MGATVAARINPNAHRKQQRTRDFLIPATNQSSPTAQYLTKALQIVHSQLTKISQNGGFIVLDLVH